MGEKFAFAKANSFQSHQFYQGLCDLKKIGNPLIATFVLA
ncbi:hypothetical protein NMS_1129 [Nonlabens marinus S1-08]|uniref:Uncharacterized protein n=1 Tax=Nonlabens marinus S1-08 TaxID=1454201 RepID=W8VV53_9FLAO|nr:hypothetical protein NMS_1129 [Nonlabens marinus S1-08]